MHPHSQFFLTGPRTWLKPFVTELRNMINKVYMLVRSHSSIKQTCWTDPWTGFKHCTSVPAGAVSTPAFSKIGQMSQRKQF